MKTTKKTFKEVLEELATDEKLSSAKLYALSKMNRECLQTFSQIWPTIEVQRRRTIVQELMETAEVNFEVDFDPVFLTALGDEDAQVRATAIRSLWEYEQPSLITPLIHLLKTDEAEIVREAAAGALGKFVFLKELEEIDWHQGELAEEALLTTIHQASETLDVRRRAIESMAYSSHPRVIDIIEAAYYSDYDKMQVSAIFAMGRSADVRWVPRVIEELDNPSTEVRYEAARACGELESKEAVDRLIQLLEEDEDSEVQEMVIWALGRIGGSKARHVLEAYLDSEADNLALAAEESLDELNLFDDAMMLYDFEFDDEEDELDDWFDDESYQGNGNGYYH